MRDYIYMGGKLVAEYRPQENAYFYCTSDQISSTRIVTDDSGAVVYVAAHDPYGGIQKTWTSAYDPALKFSGKERDTESGLDYFGARYYDHNLYRFLSVDPVSDVGRAYYNPQLWNRYAFCRNNPISYFELSGLLAVRIDGWNIIDEEYGTFCCYDRKGKPVYLRGYAFTTILSQDIKVSFENPNEIRINVKFTTFILNQDSKWWTYEDAWLSRSTYDSIKRHEMMHISDVMVLVTPWLKKIENQWLKGKITDSEAEDKINKAFQRAMKWSADLRDNWFAQFYEMQIRWIEELFPDYGTNLFLQWLLAPSFIDFFR